MIPRTVQMAKAVETTFTVPQLEDYGNIILNGYLSLVPNTINKKAWQYKETTTAPVNLPFLWESRPALKGWTTNYLQYYTELPPNAYGVDPGNPTMFNYTVHSFTPATGPITSLVGLAGGTGYFTGTHLGVPAVGGSGSGATLDLVIGVGGIVVSATLANPGTGYTEGDGLTVTTLGPGYGFAVTVGPIGGPVTAIGVPTAGAGYTPGAYVGVATTTTGFGSGATLDITVDASGRVISAALNAPGSNYAVGDTLTTAAIGPGTGFTVAITSVSTAGPAGEPKWAQAPRRLINGTIAPYVPPGPNSQAIQYSGILYPVADNPVAPPIGQL